MLNLARGNGDRTRHFILRPGVFLRASSRDGQPHGQRLPRFVTLSGVTHPPGTPDCPEFVASFLGR